MPLPDAEHPSSPFAERGRVVSHWAVYYTGRTDGRTLEVGAGIPTNQKAVADYMVRTISGRLLDRAFTNMTERTAYLPYYTGTVAGLGNLGILTYAIPTRDQWGYTIKFGLPPEKLADEPDIQAVIAGAEPGAKPVIASTLHIGEVRAASVLIVPTDTKSAFTRDFLASGLATEHGFVRADSQQPGSSPRWRPETPPSALSDSIELIEFLNIVDFNVERV